MEEVKEIADEYRRWTHERSPKEDVGDPSTHRVYLPLADVGGRPVLRVMVPSVGS